MFTTSSAINIGDSRQNSEDKILVMNSFFEVFFMSKDIFMLLLFQNHNEFCFGSFIKSIYKLSIDMFYNSLEEVFSSNLGLIAIRILIAPI